MELVYLWIDKYKNIEKQGFCFSPKFKCSFNPETNELVIEEKEKKSIFPENINITAIVGKNGSGKSSVEEYIYKFLYDKFSNNNEKDKKGFIVFYNNDNNFEVKNYDINIKIKYKDNQGEIEIKNTKDIIGDIYNIFIDFTILKDNIMNDKYNYKTNYALEPTRLFKTGTQITKIEPVSMDSYLKVKTIMFYYFVNKKNKENLLKEINFPVTIKKINFINSIKRTNKGLENVFSKKLSNEFENEKIKELIKQLEKSYNNNKDNENKDNEKKDNENNLSKILLEEIKKIIEYIINENNNNKDENKNVEIEYGDLLKCIDSKNLNEKEFFKLLELLHVFIEIDVEFENEKDKFKFNNLSTGQQIIIGYLGILFADLEFYAADRKNIYIFFDEIETGFHPQLQKQFINYLLSIFKLIYDDKKFHFIFLTHSPFILSDIPKENIIFLKEGKNVSDEVNIETFGANIHTLLSHAFFMEDGLIGDFAKDKINDVIKFLNKEESKIKDINEAEYIINLIGEPIIKSQLQKILKNLKEENISDDVNILKQKVKELEEQIKELESEKNKSN